MSSSSASSYTKRKKRILLVDDEADITTTLKKGLEESGLFAVDTFTEPQLALSNFKAGLYDLLLIDVKMPQMNGFQLYQEMRKKMIKEKGKEGERAGEEDIKVCFITAYEVYYETLKKEEFPSLNVGCFIKKPIQIKDLVSRIKEELQLPPSLQ